MSHLVHLLENTWTKSDLNHIETVFMVPLLSSRTVFGIPIHTILLLYHIGEFCCPITAVEYHLLYTMIRVLRVKMGSNDRIDAYLTRLNHLRISLHWPSTSRIRINSSEFLQSTFSIFPHLNAIVVQSDCEQKVGVFLPRDGELPGGLLRVWMYEWCGCRLR